MSVITTVSVYRNGETTPRHTAIGVQLDDISASVIAASNGAIPENSYTLYSLCGVPDIQLSDLLIDEIYRDFKTNNLWQYRVRGTPDPNYGAYLSVMVIRDAGT